MNRPCAPQRIWRSNVHDVSMGRPPSSARAAFSALAATLLALPVLVGCTGQYKGGKVTASPAKAVVLFDVAGTYGPEFTDVLATELTEACRKRLVVIKAREKPNLIEALERGAQASYVRDLGAQAYIKGEMTRSERVHVLWYCLAGNFEVHDAETEAQVGGVPNAEFAGDLDFGTNCFRKDVGPSDAKKTHQIFAWWIATLLARGLGY